MKFISTRGASTERVDAAQAIKQGLAADGGLFMPEEIPTLSDNEIMALSDDELAAKLEAARAAETAAVLAADAEINAKYH